MMRTFLAMISLILVVMLNGEVVVKPEFEMSNTIIGDEESGSKVIQSSALTVDNYGNVYIIDGMDQSIKVFDEKGEFKYKFGKSGQGPGEFVRAQSIVVTKDNIFVSDAGRRVVSKFDLDGTFVDNIPFTGDVPSSMKVIDDDTIVGLVIGSEQKDGKFFVVGALKIFDSLLNEKSVVEKFMTPLDLTNPQLNPMDFMPSYSGNGDKLYFGKIDENRYQISSYGIQSNDQKNIKRRYRKVRMSDEAVARMERSVRVETDTDGERNSVDNEMNDSYHKAIQASWVDKYGNLLVMAADQIYTDKLYFDIFKRDKLVGKMEFPIEIGDRGFTSSIILSFYNDKAYVIGEDDNGEMVLNVYQYNYDI